jgi:hypothetical protein
VKLRLESARYILGTFIAKFDRCCVNRSYLNALLLCLALLFGSSMRSLDFNEPD